MGSQSELLRRGAYIYRKNVRLLSDKLNGTVIRIGYGRGIDSLNEWQAGFCAWTAERTGQSETVVRERLLQSLNAIRGGHGGGDYRRFCALSYGIYLPFAADDADEVVKAYQFHRHLHFLRMLSYHVPENLEHHPALVGTRGPEALRIIDFGCGLAQKSVALVRAARAGGRPVSLALADVTALQLEFLAWFCAKDAIPVETFHCTEATPFPDFAPADILLAEEVLEHVHDPVQHVEVLDRMVAPGGFFIGNVAEHGAEFMHVSPNLAQARHRLLALGYTEIEPDHIFRKPGGIEGRALHDLAEAVV